MQDYDPQELIEKYLDNDLNADEQLSFNRAIKDPAFQKELMIQARLVDSLENAQAEDLIHQIKKLADSNNGERSMSSSKLLPQALKIAAAILILLSVLYFLNPFGKSGYDQQVNTYMIDYPVELVERGTNNDPYMQWSSTQKAILKDGLKAYTNQEYARAAAAFEKLEIQDEKILLNQATSYLRMKQSDKAIQLLRTLCSSSNIKIAENANWYLALAYLQNNDVQRSIDLLNMITKNDDGMWSRQAKALLTELLH